MRETAVPRGRAGAASVVVAAAVLAATSAACETEPPAAVPDRPGDEVVPAVAVEPGERPEVHGSEESPPTELVVEELTSADGPRVDETTEVVTVHLLAHGWSSGAVIASSWERGAPRTIGLEGTIPGFRRGIAGMAVGERRRIVVPRDLGYGDQRPSQLDEDEPIVFVVDLLGVE